MAAVPMQCGAESLRGRHVAIARSIARLLAVAGFALAGWIALAAVNDAAMADDGTSRNGAPLDLAANAADGGRGEAGAATGTGEDAAPRTEPGLATLRHLKVRRGLSPLEPAEAVVDDVREVGRQPVRYVHERRQDVLHDKGTAVRAVRGLDDVVDVPGVPRLRARDAASEPSVLTELVQNVTDGRPLQQPAGDAPADERPQQDAQPRQDEPTAAEQQALPDHAVQVAPGKYVPAPFADAVDADDLPDADECATCRNGSGPLDAPPALPGQDAPRSGSASGGHLVGPFADLATAVDPAAAPLGLTLSTFERTALTDIAAPGRPVVVPD